MRRTAVRHYMIRWRVSSAVALHVATAAISLQLTCVALRATSPAVLQVSSALQRDLLKGLADAAREQSRSSVTAVVNAVSPVVAQAVAGSLQRELAGGHPCAVYAHYGQCLSAAT
jgi:hypothetical protein